MSASESGRRDPPRDPEEVSLAIAARRGDQRSFEILTQRYMEKAVMIATSYVGNREDARDLAQEAFYRVLKSFDRFREGKPFAPWFYRILRNVCLNFLEKRRLRRALSIHPEEGEKTGIHLPSTAPGPQEECLSRESARMLAAAMRELPPRHREILMLRHYEDLDYASIAEILEIPIGTVMSRLFHARQKLKGLLAGYAEDRS
ncbi:MAG: RNA polymerase sigma factor RpoE [Planctomycetota bacterium]